MDNTNTDLSTQLQSSMAYTKETSSNGHHIPIVEGVERYPEIGADSPEKTSLRDRIVYPFRAIRNRILNITVLGALAGVAVSICVPAVVGAAVGGVVGGVVKLAKVLSGHDSSALPVGVAIGALTGLCVGGVVALPLAAVSAVAFSVIGLVGSAMYLPVDIYHAATLSKPELEELEDQQEVKFERMMDVLQDNFVKSKVDSNTGEVAISWNVCKVEYKP